MTEYDEFATGEEKSRLPARWADVAMYSAPPLVEPGDKITPRVSLVSMTRNPLRVMAAAAETYQGGVYRDPATVTHAQCMKWLNGFKDSAITAPLEFVSLHFYFEGVTRAFTHQLVRQRTATFVQESMRFAVKENAAWEVADPPSLEGLKDDHPWRLTWDAATSYAAQAYNRLVANGMPAEDARGLLPTNITTRVHYHTDLLNLTRQAGNRLCSQAQHEWKIVWNQMILAILNYGSTDERWQQKEIVKLFKPVCYQKGSCGFHGPADRWCVIRDRVDAHAAAGDPSDTWTDINPREPLHHAAARKPNA
jgi:flavin-dependent thymidylate synthase